MIFKKNTFFFINCYGNHISQIEWLTKLFFGIFFSLKIMALWGGVHVAELGSIQNWYWRTPQYLPVQLPVLVGHVTSLCLQIVIKVKVLLTVSCPIFPSILRAKNLLTGSLKNRSIDNLEMQKKSISMKNSQFFDYLLYAKPK